MDMLLFLMILIQNVFINTVKISIYKMFVYSKRELCLYVYIISRILLEK